MSEKGLLKAILDAPDDDVPRLVYADWLEEHGDARAEFIRVQCRFAKLDEGDLDYQPLWQRYWELLRPNQLAWQQQLPAWARRLRCTFRRGFVAEAQLTPRQFLDKLPSLRRRTPLEGVAFTDTSVKVDVKALAASPHLAGLSLLRLRGIWKWYHDTGGGSAPEDLRSLTESPHLDSLRELDLSDLRVGTDGARLLADSPNFAGLTTLKLRSCGLTPDGLAALGKAPFAQKVTTLNLACNFFADAGASALTGLSFPHLKDLDLAVNSITGEGLDALADAPFLPGLKRLDLGSDNFTGPDLTHLFAPGRLTSLRVLDLDACKVRGGGGESIANASLPALTTLILSNNELPDEDVIALASSTHLRGLQTLNLWANRLGDDAVKALARAQRLPALKDLTLGDNPAITDEGARALAESPLADQLVRLGFWRTGISHKGRKVLEDHFGERLNLG